MSQPRVRVEVLRLLETALLWEDATDDEVCWRLSDSVTHVSVLVSRCERCSVAVCRHMDEEYCATRHLHVKSRSMRRYDIKIADNASAGLEKGKVVTNMDDVFCLKGHCVDDSHCTRSLLALSVTLIVVGLNAGCRRTVGQGGCH